MPESITIIRAGLDEVDSVATLFDGYRRFYEQASDPDGAASFIRERLERRESTIFLAQTEVNGARTSVGFAQLYPLFSSVRMTRTWLLNDLFVDPDFRGRGVGRKLMEHVHEQARIGGRRGVELATARSNVRAQALYEDLGYKRDDEYFHYSRSV